VASYETLRYEADGPIAWVTLNRRAGRLPAAEDRGGPMEAGYRQALDIGRTLVMLGTDQSVLSDQQKVFSAGTGLPRRAR
jgi:hypothetical protein